MAPDGTGQRRLNREGDTAAVREEADPAWSPDGRCIAYLVREGGRAALWTAEVDTGRRWRIAADAENPAWSPDGRFLAWSSDRDGDPELYLARADGSGATRLTRARGADWLPRWVAGAFPAAP